MSLTDDKIEFYRAHLARDPRFDGKFFVAVKTTRIYCRPICPAKKAQFKNLEFFTYATQAEEAGYRPCLRCRPETAPGSTAWAGTSAIVQRAIRMMDCYALEELSIQGLAAKLGIGARWLRELFQQQVGVSPQSILLSKKLDIARNLLDQSSLPITEIAFSAGFKSIRRFNDAFKIRFQKTPRVFRRNPSAERQLRLQLGYRPPYNWPQLLQFFTNRSIPQTELITSNSYQRLITYGEVRGWFQAKYDGQNKISVEFKLNKNANIVEFSTRIKNIFDLDADPMAIENSLQEDPKLQPFLTQYSGLRIPGCWDGFELAIRAVVGQKISVKAARTVLSKMVELCGEKQALDASLPLTRFFPTPENILTANLSTIGLTQSKITTIQALAPSVGSLIFFRLLQGASGALLISSSLALISRLYPEAKQRAHAIGIWAALGGVACASGPFLGGFLTSLFSWRLIFFVNVLIGACSLGLILYSVYDWPSAGIDRFLSRRKINCTSRGCKNHCWRIVVQRKTSRSYRSHFRC